MISPGVDATDYDSQGAMERDKGWLGYTHLNSVRSGLIFYLLNFAFLNNEIIIEHNFQEDDRGHQRAAKWESGLVQTPRPHQVDHSRRATGDAGHAALPNVHPYRCFIY